MDEMGMMDNEMTAVCLFDIYRGVFAPEEFQAESSKATSDVHASAKLSLMLYLLQTSTRQGGQASSVPIKAFLGDLVDGIHRELVLPDAKKAAETGLEQYLGSLEYTKLLAICELIDTHFYRPDLDRWENKLRKADDLAYFKDSELESTGGKLEQTISLLQLKIHNYAVLEKI